MIERKDYNPYTLIENNNKFFRRMMGKLSFLKQICIFFFYAFIEKISNRYYEKIVIGFPFSCALIFLLIFKPNKYCVLGDGSSIFFSKEYDTNIQSKFLKNFFVNYNFKYCTENFFEKKWLFINRYY